MNPITVFLTVACLAVGAGLGATGYLYSGVPFVIAAIIIAAALKMANLIEAEERKKHIVYSSRTRLNTDNFREKHALRQAIVELFEQLPPPLKQNEKPRKL